MVLAAILIPAVAAFAGLAWATAMVYGANQEGRRAADFAALATAASLPMFNLSASCQVTGSGTVPLTPPTTTVPTLPGGSTIPTVTTQPPPTVPTTTTPTTSAPPTVPSTTAPTTPSTLPGGSTVPTTQAPPTTPAPPSTLPGGSTIPAAPTTTIPAVPLVPPVVDPVNNPQNIPCTKQAGLPLPPYSGDVHLPDASVDVTNGACNMANEQFANGRSMVTGVFFDRHNTTCTPTPVFTELWEQQLANCLSNYNVAANCATNLQQSITGDPNAKVDSTVALVQALLKQKTGQDIPTCQSLALPTPAQCVGTSDLLSKVQGAQAAVCAALAQASGCSALQPLLDQLGKATVNTDLRMLAPGLLTPAVQVRVEQTVKVPGLSLLGLVDQHVTNTATARRVFKNAVLLPSLPLPDFTGGYSLDPNADLAIARQPTLDLLRGLNAQMTPVLDAAMKQVVCPSSPSSCGVSDAFGQQIDDVSDIYNPPPGGAAPSASDMLTNAQNAGSALVVSPLRELKLSANPDPAHAGETTVCSNDPNALVSNCLSTAAATALKGILGLSSQVYVPALQFVPVLLEQGQGFVKACPLVMDGMANTSFPSDLPKCTADFMSNATKLKGLFRARLIG